MNRNSIQQFDLMIWIDVINSMPRWIDYLLDESARKCTNHVFSSIHFQFKSDD